MIAESNAGYRLVTAGLFGCLFAGQAALITMSPVLADAARDLDVSTAAAGQLRSVAGLAAGVTAVTLSVVAGRVGLARQLVAAAALLALGSLASAFAPSFAILAIAQLPIGVAVATLTTVGTLAAAEWVPPAHRPRVLSRVLIGQPAAWIVGMPLVGLVGDWGWRYAWLALPFVASIAALGLVAPRARSAMPAVRGAPALRALDDRSIARWLASELFANSAWAGTLVYAGALFVDSHGTSIRLTGLLLALGACAFVGGNLILSRLAPHEPRRALVVLAVGLALSDGLFGVVRADVVTSALLFSVAAFVAGGRSLVASWFALSVSPDIRPTVTSLRVATTQFGYLIGAVAAGTALALGGYGAFGTTMASFFLAAAALATGGAPRPLPPVYRPHPRPATAVESTAGVT